MFKENIIISGVYNSKLCEHLLRFGINRFVFDLRPKSFNFITLKELEFIFRNFGQEIFPLFFVNSEDFLSNNYIFEKLNNLVDPIVTVLSESSSLEIGRKEEKKYIKVISEDEISRRSFLNFKYEQFIGIYIYCQNLNIFRDNPIFLKWLFEMKRMGKKSMLLADWKGQEYRRLDSIPVDNYLFEIHSGLETDYRKINFNMLEEQLSHLIINTRDQ